MNIQFGIERMTLFFKKISTWLGWKCIQENWELITILSVAGLCFGKWVIPYILTNYYIKKIFQLEFSFDWLLIFIVSLMPFVGYRRAKNFWQRYWNNSQSLKKIPFTYIDGIFVFLTFLIIAICFNQTLFKKIELSAPSKIWLICLFLAALFWSVSLKFASKGAKHLELPILRSDQYIDLHFFPDEPIEQIEQDLLDRAEFIDKLSQRIIKYPFSESFVFGLHAGWGEGKTSVLRLLRDKLEKEEHIIVVEFDPWYFASQNAIIKGFYENFYIYLNKHFFLPNFKATVIKYTKVLNLGFKASSGVSFGFTMSDESIEELKSRVENCIDYTGKRVVILIDNVDRLNKDEILQVFQIVKLSAKLKNVVFVLSFDYNVVSSHFEDEISTDPSYIEKIIQSPINMPPAEQVAIDRFLYRPYQHDHISPISGLFKILEIDEQRINEFHDSFDYAYVKYARYLFPTLRAAKRYLNGLYSTLPSVKGEVNLRDFFILELVRIFYPLVYRDIWQKPQYYISVGWSSDTWWTGAIPNNEVNRYTSIKEHLEKVLPPNDEISKKLLEELFPEIHYALHDIKTKVAADRDVYRKAQKITHPDVFPRYFLMHIPQGELSDERVKATISEWNGYDPDILNTKIVEEFDKLHEENKLDEFLTKLRIFYQAIESHTAIILIKYINKNIKIFLEKFQIGFTESEFSYLILPLLNDKVEHNKIMPLLEEIVADKSSLNLAARLLLMISESGSYYTVQENIDIKVLYENFFKQMDEYFILEKRDLFDGESTLYGLTVHLARWARSYKIKLNKYIISLIISHHHYLGRFIMMYQPAIGNNEEFLQVFDAESIYKIATQYLSECYSDEHEKQAIEAFMRLYEAKKSP